MRNNFLFFLIALSISILCIQPAFAQETVTVYDGTNTNGYVPVYGSWADAYNKCEFIMNADQLGDLPVGSTITGLKWYMSTTPSAAWGGNFQIFIKEVDATSLSDFTGTDGATVVWTGALDGTSGYVDLEFNQNYTYNGGNLLIGVYQTQKGTYKTSAFYGVGTDGASVSGYSSSSLDAIAATQRNFVPKTSFTYTPSSGAVYYKPTNLVISDITPNSAKIAWTPGGDETAWNVEYKKASDETWTQESVSGTPELMLDALENGAAYDVQVQAVYADGQSKWLHGSFQTLVCDAAEMGEITYELTDTYGDGWNSNKLQIVYNGTVIEELTIGPGKQVTGNVALCYGVDYDLVWVAGSYGYECGFTITGPDGSVIYEFHGTGSSSGGSPNPGVLTTFSIRSDADFLIDGLYYIINNDNTTVTVTHPCSSPYHYNDLTNANIPESVYYNDMSYKVTTIGNSAFRGCNSLTSAYIPNSVKSIGTSAFYGCNGLTSVTIPNSVTTIGERAFYGCAGLTSVTIPNSVTSIGECAFEGCRGLTSVTIPNSVTTIGERAFYGCAGLTSVTLKSNAIVSKNYSSSSNIKNIFGAQVTTYILGEDITKIGSDAFNNCSGLKSLTIGNSVTSIGSSAFYKCTDLTSVSIPNSVTLIGDFAFFGCSGLNSIIVDSGNSMYDSRENCNAIIETRTNTIILGCKNTIFPNSVTKIGEYAYGECTDLTSVTIPNSITRIGIYAFYNCTGLTSVTIGNSVTSIGRAAFSSCTGLTSVTIGNSVASIEDYAFDKCRGLTSVTIPNSVTEIGDYAFSECRGLTSVTIPNSVTTIGRSAFSECTGLTSVTLNSNSIVSKNYSSSSNIKNIFGAQVTTYILGEDITSIGSYAFSSCTGLASVTIPNSVTAIGSSAFRNCTGLAELYCYAFEPPTLGSNCFNGVNSEIPVYVPIIGTYMEDQSWSKYFSNFLPLGNIQKLTVNLPSAASGGIYKDMYIKVYNTITSDYNRCLVTDKMSYNFSVPSNATYDIALENSMGTKFGEIKDVLVGSDDMEVTFPSLLTPQTVAVAVTLPDGVDVTDKTNITWTAADSTFLAHGAILGGLIQGQQLNYEIKLPQDLSVSYVQPDKQRYEVKPNNNSFLVKLQPFGNVLIAGKVKDATTGLPLQYAAIVTLSQTLNGKQSKSRVTSTDDSGCFVIEALTAPSLLTVAAQGYVSHTTELAAVTENLNLDTLSLNPITGVVLQTNLTYRPSAPSGQSAATTDFYNDYQNVSFSLRNLASNKDITQYQVQFPQIVLLEDVADGDRIEVTAHSLKGIFNDVSAECVVEEGSADVTLPLVERGGIEACYSSSDASSVTGKLFNSAGEQVMRDVYQGSNLTLSNLPDGNYTLVSMQSSESYNSVLTLEGLTSVGLNAGTDYITSSVNVASGIISSVDIGNVPVLNQNLLNYTSANTRFTANKTSQTIGNYVTLTANVDFKKAYQGDINDAQLIVDLPQGCDLVDNSLIFNNNLTSYLIEGNRLRVGLTDGGGNAKFCVIPSEAGVVMPSASVQFTYKGKTITEPIGAAVFIVNNLEIRVPSVVSRPEITVTGACPFNSQVNVYDNGELIGTTSTHSNFWSTTCTLSNTANLSTHEINAIATTPQGTELMSETAECLYDNNAIEVSKVTMYYDNSWNHNTYTIVYDFINGTSSKSSFDFYSSNDPFTFTIDFTDNDTTKIFNVLLRVKTSAGTWESLNAKFDENMSCWVASSKFSSSRIPVNVAVSYDYNTQSLLSAEVYDASVNYYNDWQTAFQHETANINQALDELNTLWDNDDYGSEASVAQIHEIYESLGITIDDGPVEIYTDEEMDALLAECEQVLADSLGFQPDLLFQQSFEEINAMTEGFNISHCTGMTEEQLIGDGYQKMEKDDGTCIFIYTDESTMKIADLSNDVYYEFDFTSGNTLLAPLFALAQGDDNFEARMNAYSEKVGSLCESVRSKLVDLANLLDDIFKELLARSNQLERYLNICENQINHLKSLEHLTLDQSLRLAKYEFYRAQYTKELAINNKIKDFLLNLDTKSLRLGKIKFNGITGMGKYVRWANKVFVAYDIFSLLKGWKTDIGKIFDTYFMIPNPCKNDEVGANVMRAAVISLGVSAGAYYTAQLLLDGSALSTTIAGGVAALPSGGTSLSIVAVSIGVALASYAATVAWNKNFDKLIAYQRNSIKLLSCYNDPEDLPNEPNDPTWHHPNCPDVRPVLDPSGFVYEGVLSNRLQGVTATIYYKETVEDMWGEQHEQEVMWDAEEYAQKNPLFTDENGMYQWDVPQGLWQVRFNKNGYEPTQSEWLPVPPPQLDVNIGMTQLRQPEVAMVHAYKNGVELTFDKYMRIETLTTDNISVTQDGNNVPGTIELVNEEQGDNEKLASKVRFVPASEFTAESVTLTVKNNVESYAGIRMNSDFTQSFDIEEQIYVIGIDSLVNVGYGESRHVLVEALPVDVARGKTLNVRSNQPIIAEVDQETYTLDKHGRANITVNGNLPGATSLTLNVEGFDLRRNATVQVVDVSSRVTEKPIASVNNGMVFDDQITVELSCSTPGAVIYYTTDGTCPCDEEERILYDGPITISSNTTLKAIAIAPGYYESDIATYYYFQSSAIDEISCDAPFKVTPTMVHDGFVVKGNFEDCDVRLYSINGREILHNARVLSDEFVSLSNLSSGIYIAVITVYGRPYPVRIIKI